MSDVPNAIVLKFQPVEADVVSQGRLGPRLELGKTQLHAQAFDMGEYIPGAAKLNHPIISLPLKDMRAWLDRHGYKLHPLAGGVWVQ